MSYWGVYVCVKAALTAEMSDFYSALVTFSQSKLTTWLVPELPVGLTSQAGCQLAASGGQNPMSDRPHSLGVYLPASDPTEPRCLLFGCQV